MLPDILVYIRDGENEELRYAIRSWCKNVSFNKLIVVGGAKPPKWLKPDLFIQNPASLGKVRQAYGNIKIGIADSRVSEDVLLMMDDVFVYKNLGEWPQNFNFNRGTLMNQWEACMEKTSGNPYGAMIKNTYNKLKSKVEKPLSFEEHCPFWCNRKKMQQIFDLYKDDIFDLLPRSLYGNLNACSTKYKSDFKANNHSDLAPEDAIFVSTNDITFKNGKIGPYIRARFPLPSKYEK